MIQPERHQLEVASLGTEPAGPTYQQYGVKPEVANRVAADFGASDSASKKHWGPHQGLLWTHCPRVDIARAVAKIRKDRSEAVLGVPMG